MNRVERLTGLLLALQQGQQTAQQLADRFEVSRRTILRDLDALSQIGVPLISTQGRTGGFRVQDGYWLPPLHLSVEEATAMLFALGLAEDARGDSPLGQAHLTAREKLESVLGTDIRIAARSKVEEIQVTRHHAITDSIITRAIRTSIPEQQWLRMVYRSAREESTRTILPVSLTVSYGKWYVQTVDELKCSMRNFRLDRIQQVHRTIPPINAADIVARATSESAAYRDIANPEVHVALTETGVMLALDHPDFHQWVTQEAQGASLRFRCPANELPFYATELVRFGVEATILAPDELRCMAVEHAESIRRHHHRGNRSGASEGRKKR